MSKNSETMGVVKRWCRDVTSTETKIVSGGSGSEMDCIMEIDLQVICIFDLGRKSLNERL